MQVILVNSTVHTCRWATFHVLPSEIELGGQAPDMRARLDRNPLWKCLHDNLDNEEAQGYLVLAGNVMYAPAGGGHHWLHCDVLENTVTEGTDVFFAEEQGGGRGYEEDAAGIVAEIEAARQRRDGQAVWDDLDSSSG